MLEVDIMNYFTKDKPYNTLNEYYRKTYGHKIAKISLNANFTCPNKDGKKGYGGCIYCSKMGSGDFAGNKELPLDLQFKEVKEIISKKWPNAKYIAYLQANSNTYGDIAHLKEIYEKVLNIDSDIIGLDIATRADCISLDIASYLGKLNKTKKITVELGLQSASDETKKFINQMETNDEFIYAINLLRKENIDVVLHIINGLPNENKEDMLNTIQFINTLDIQGIKFHSLLILEHTKLGAMYKENPFNVLTLEEYVDIVVDQICLLRGDIIIHRLAADGVYSDLIEPKWTMKKMVVMNEIDKKLRNNQLYQGIKYEGC